MLVGVPHKDATFKTHPLNFLSERTLKGTFFGNYKPRSDLPSVVEKYLSKVCRLFSFHELALCLFNGNGERIGSEIVAGIGGGEVHNTRSPIC